ncbi:MAG: hypothetical protein RLZZ618_1804 [Pseudomonadota bacterium]|jgi:hypothetical protein
MGRALLLRWRWWLTLALLAGSVASHAASPYQIGVYYYPGWSPYTKGAHEPDPWAVIKRFPDREPKLGWYHDGKGDTLDQQLAWMADHGISFTVFDWYWENGKPAPQSSVRAYLQSPQRARVKYALLWANHTREPRNLAEWDALTSFWIDNHLKNPEYVLIDGKPALFVFSPDGLRDQAKVIGLPVDKLLDRARSKAREAGLKGIYFVMSTPADEFWARDFAPKAGFDALSAYNYHFGVDEHLKAGRMSYSFDELDRGYRTHWKWLVARSPLPYIVPMTSGWDKRPWGGSRDRRHDDSMSTPDEFETHLRAGKALMDANPDKTHRMGVICCWNEYGEGSYIEPTKAHGTAYLERVRKVFGGR